MEEPGLIEGISVGAGGTEAEVEKDVNPICHVLTVLMRGLC